VVDDGYAADPLWPVLPATETLVRFCRREYDCAVACGKKAQQLHPYVQLARVFYAQALEYSGNWGEALAQYRHACVICPDLPWLRALEGVCLARSRRTAEASGVLAELDQRRMSEYVDAYYMALLRDAVGRRDEAFLALERACAEGSTVLSILDIDPIMDSLRTDPRFPRIRDLAAPRLARDSGQAA